MSRREQLLAALAEGDASHAELLARLPAEPPWTASILRVNLTYLMQCGVVWVCELGNYTDESPRRYTTDPTKAVPAVRKPAKRVKPSGHTPGGTVRAAIRNRSPLESAWAGARQ